MITGKLCGSVTGAVNSTYKGVSTDSVKVAVDNINNTISAKLLVNYKNQVFFFDKFVAGKNVQEQFTESEFVYCYDGTSIKGGDTGPNIVLHFPQTSGRAIYLKKIHIKYIEDGISKEYNHEFIMGDFTAIGQIATLDNVKWELQNDITDVYFGTSESEYGLQIGSNKKPAKNLSLKTGDFIHKTIKEIIVTACGAASANVLLSIDVGGFDWLYHENQADQATSIKLAQNDISSPLSFTYKDGTTLEEAVITEYKNVFLRKDEDEIVVNQPQEEFLYINRENNRAYRFDGTTLIEVSKVLELGSTADTAYRGDWGQQNYTNIQNILNKDVTLKGNKTIEGNLIIADTESHPAELRIKNSDPSYDDIIIGYNDDGDQFAASLPALHVSALFAPEKTSHPYIECWSDIQFENDNKITGIPDPINEKDVANKKYVDEKAIEVSTYDASLSATSTNAVQNKVVNSTISELSYQLAMVRENLFQTVLSEIDHTEDFATLYPIPDTLSDSDGTHRVLFSETQLREVAGNSIVLKQLLTAKGNSETINGITFTHNGDGTISVVGTATAITNHYFDGPTGGLLANHKYLLKGCPAGGGENSYTLYCSGNLYDRGNGFIATITSNQTPSCRIEIYNGITINATFRPQLFDIADSITTVEEFNRIFPNDYYPYNAGEIRNTTASGIKVNGYNLFDGEFEGGAYSGSTGLKENGENAFRSVGYTKVAPGKKYTLYFENIMPGGAYVSEYDKDKKYIKRTSDDTVFDLTLTSSTQYITIFYYKSGSNWGSNVPTNSNTCFHLSTLRTGYAPYKESKAISFASTELLGAGEAHDTIEVVEGDKVAGIQRYNLVQVKRVGTVDLGTINWVYESGNARFYSASTIDGMAVKPYGQNIYPNIVCSKYPTVPTYNIDQHQDKAISTNNSQATPRIFVTDSSYTDATAFKTAMSGVILNYELATPTRTTIAENLTFEEVSATIEQGGSIETIYETLAPNCTTGFVVKKATEVSK